ncbi:hypothetical protein PAAG_12704 [Paracoccidioides lutzii Pb01]|uniref:Endonuclease/exonuclease/phosphatase domain-containing protein n=1 Tax=Paracoccidioides lutzii (strain ATCC MYA-826 / Pb01) TaxID=502779 RepID=A0A0A2VIA6_PARBA|nr:hypothetical protein PAAG_12704 [Paracoccidioides lutzii Pb01]KGQ00639.1 hypothetical protein PAAG_12704 [Paracoccidioides lutzii Pb01]
MQVNVGKGGPAHETALNLAFERKTDILLIQEPWIHRNLSQRISKKHPAFNCFAPIEKWDRKPRVLTYVHKHPQIHAHAVPGPWAENRDIHMLHIQAWGLQLQTVNIYNAPPGAEDPGQGVGCLLSWSVPALPLLLAGDLNIKHPVWQPGVPPSRWAEPFLQWTMNFNFTLTMDPDTPTRTIQRRRARLGYADDLGLLSAGTTLEGNVVTLQEDFKLLNDWASKEGLTFDFAKTEIAHFTRRRTLSNPSIDLETTSGTHSITAKAVKSSIRYLGIWLDRKLSFKKHVETMAAKARQVSNGIRALSNTARGAPVQLLRQSIQACVLSVLCYGAEAWWPGATRMEKGKEISN